MRQTYTRRTLFALTGGAALGVGTFGRTMGHAQQNESPFTFASGQILTWTDPWSHADAYGPVKEYLPNAVLLEGDNQAQVIFGYFDMPQKFNDVTTSIIELVTGDVTLALSLVGGGGTIPGTDGAPDSTYSYATFHLNMEGDAVGLYVELVNEVQITIFVSAVAFFGSEMASAHDSVQVDEVGMFEGIDGAELQRLLESRTTTSAAIGEFIHESGTAHVTWTNGWTESGRDEAGVTLTHPDGSVIVYATVYPVEVDSWQGLADIDVAFLHDDQGPDATVIGPLVTEDRFSFVTDGTYGLRFAQGIATENPDLYVLVFAANFASGIDPADAVALVQEAQAAITINGSPALEGLDTLIEA